MNLRERIGMVLEALGQIGPFDEYWDAVDPRLERTEQDRRGPGDPSADSDDRRWPAA